MSKTSDRKMAGFAFVELVVVIVLMALLVLWVLPAMFKNRNNVQRISCINNLKQIGIAYRIFATDNNDLLPAQIATGNGGWKDLLTNGAGGPYCWTNFALMHVELGESPRVVVCPQDERQPTFHSDKLIPGSIPFGSANFNNKTLSYFVGVGVGASESFSKAILGGDRNLCFGPKPDTKYGFSPDSGLGNDIVIPTNSAARPLSWSRKMHSEKSAGESGTILFGDGSVLHCNSVQLRKFQCAAMDSGNWASNSIPKTPSFRLVFP